MRLANVQRLDFADEGVTLTKDEDATARRLKINGATEDEIAFLLRRVELNAMLPDVFVLFVEADLVANCVRKVVPAAAGLDQTYAAMRREPMARQGLEAELGRLNEELIATPGDLEEQVRDHPEATWDAAVRAIVEEDDDGVTKLGTGREAPPQAEVEQHRRPVCRLFHRHD